MILGCYRRSGIFLRDDLCVGVGEERKKRWKKGRKGDGIKYNRLVLAKLV